MPTPSVEEIALAIGSDENEASYFDQASIAQHWNWTVAYQVPTRGHPTRIFQSAVAGAVVSSGRLQPDYISRKVAWRCSLVPPGHEMVIRKALSSRASTL